jgi:hypothetical protein
MFLIDNMTVSVKARPSSLNSAEVIGWGGVCVKGVGGSGWMCMCVCVRVCVRACLCVCVQC